VVHIGCAGKSADDNLQAFDFPSLNRKWDAV
jgi:hypothetical protein